MIVLIDNYDSFTHNLYQYVGTMNPDIQVFRNDKISLPELLALKPSHLLISPGPGCPSEAGISIEAIRCLGQYIPVLGICLGHQAMGEAFGARVNHSPSGPVHGKASSIHIASGCPIFSGLPPIIQAARYHSLVVDAETLPDTLAVTAETNDGIIMGLAHRSLPIYGVQFHPESILTEHGMKIISNFLRISSKERSLYHA